MFSFSLWWGGSWWGGGFILTEALTMVWANRLASLGLVNKCCGHSQRLKRADCVAFVKLTGESRAALLVWIWILGTAENRLTSFMGSRCACEIVVTAGSALCIKHFVCHWQWSYHHREDQWLLLLHYTLQSERLLMCRHIAPLKDECLLSDNMWDSFESNYFI